MSKKSKGNLMLLTTAFVFGVGFVSQRAGSAYIETFTFLGFRSTITGIVLLPVCMFFAKRRQQAGEEEKVSAEEKQQKRKELWAGGISCGAAFCIASVIQQIGLTYTAAGKAAFLSALYIIIVPVLRVLLGNRIKPAIWIGIMVAVAGLYLLCMKESFSMEKGDVFIVISAFFLAIHVLLIDHFSPKTDSEKLSCIQAFVCGLSCLVMMFIFENPTWSDILDCWAPLLYSGAIACGLGYTLQIIAQKDTEPAIAVMIVSMDSVFAAVLGAIILHEVLTLREIFGCILMLAAIVIAQWPSAERIGKTNR